MKIGQMPSPQRAANTQQQNKTDKAAPGKAAPAQSADDITQNGLQTAQLTLNNDSQGDVDYDRVAQMQAVLAAGTMSVDTDELASSMLSFFQK
ncbi:flagellar biosynthesis anti-sigma factor FlgM [Dryocola sp. BD626]|jgi:negative regulator of flagellin synthesis FlgM|uniref:flagellar biosynthesis anti-sigma factor FlgM n=1 Tax=Dryocola sp. BD626 TaxID=3133273 RepID=UPI003F50D0EE